MDVRYYDMLELDEAPTTDQIQFFIPGQRFWYDMEELGDEQVLAEVLGPPYSEPEACCAQTLVAAS